MFGSNPSQGASDHFAGLAMQVLSADPESRAGIRRAAEQEGISAAAIIARTAYAIADAMIAERGN